jgi:glycosyltransferase involved in cell wall biosynthesis
LLEQPEVVLLYGPPWDGPTRFSKHHLASYFAERGRRVLYVEAPLTIFGLGRGAQELRRALQRPRRVGERLWVRRYFLPVPYHAASPITAHRLANRVGQRFLAPALRRDLSRLSFKRPLVIAGLPHALDILPGLPRSCLVYHCADDYASVRGFPASLTQLEAELCQRANLVITTSQTLCEDRRRFNRRTYWIPNGADVAHFSQPASPAAELSRLARPLVGFVGGLSQWVDVELVAFLAQSRPAWTFVLIGPVGIDVSAVRALHNVHLLGPRPYVELPRYLAAMDAALIPFRNEPVTYHADPIKAYEYLAAGVPVVATDMPALRRLEHVVRLAESREQFREQLDAAVAEGKQARRAERQAEAARHSWSSRFDELERLISTTCLG